MSGPMEDERNKLRADILAALSRVYTEDAELLSDKIDVCERSLMHRFTHYFMEYAESGKDAFYEGLHVDGEYNRQGRDGCPKLRCGKPIYPDVIVHTRGDNRRNLCVIEFKKANNTETLMAQGFKNDVEKLEFLTGEECKFRYAWGVHIFFMVSSKPKGFRGVSMKWYKDGKQFGYSILTSSIGSGKESRFTVFNREYNKDPIRKGDIIYCRSYSRDGQYYTLTEYNKVF